MMANGGGSLSTAVAPWRGGMERGERGWVGDDLFTLTKPIAVKAAGEEEKGCELRAAGCGL